MIASDVTAYNRALKNENAKMDIYFKKGDNYVLCTGVPEQGATYYSMNYKKADKANVYTKTETDDAITEQVSGIVTDISEL